MPASRHNVLIGRNSRRLRFAAGLSDKAVAAHLGLSLKRYRACEQGIDGFDCDELLELAKLLRASVDELCEDGGQQSSTPGHEPPWNAYGVDQLLIEFNRIRSRAVRQQVCALISEIADSLETSRDATL